MLLEKLLKTDVKSFYEPSTRVFKSKRLQKALGTDEPVEITIKEIDAKLAKEFVAMQFDKKGKYDFKRAQRAIARMVVEGIVDPDLKNEELQRHFGAETPADLAEKIFGFELTEISNIILDLCGMNQDEEDAQEEFEEIKN